VVLAMIGAVTTGSLALVGEGNWPAALALYLFASIGFYSSTVFYDSLLVDVTKPRYYDFVSALGFSLGYLGGAVLLLVHVLMVMRPAWFGLASTTEAMKVAFATVGIWWAVFLVPLIRWVPEHKRGLAVTGSVLRASYRELRSTITKVGRYRNVVVFLVGYLFYIGAVFTVISMAFNYGQRLGFDSFDLVKALMITNFVGFFATFAYGWFGHHYGPKKGIYLALAVYIAASSWAGFMTDVREFYALAITIGCVQGGVQGLSRSLYASLIPADAPGEFFGFYNMITKLSHVVGPFLVGVVAVVSDDPKFILLALVPMFLVGAALLARVPGTRQAIPATEASSDRSTPGSSGP
jgi:UMF1 family MFS transporter